jgi:hypothetical protein
MVKEVVSEHMSLFPNEDILTKKLNHGKVLQITYLQKRIENYLKRC